MTDDYAKLLDFRATLFPRFDADQESAARSIIPLILDDVRAGMINTLLDVGCGTGEILHFAGEFLGGAGLSVRRVGIDASSGELGRARIRCADCDFVCCTAENLNTLDNSLAEPLDWKKTAVLCVGHTLPHFTELSVFVECLGTYRPPLVFVDFYHTWGETIEMLQKHPREVRHEMRILGDNEEMFVLATAVIPGGDRVSRGIRTMKLDGGPATFQTRFQTVQAFESRNTLIGKLETAGYVRDRELKYDAGYGHMHGTLLCDPQPESYRRISPVSGILNDAYYHAVAKLTKTVLAKEDIVASMKVFGTRAAVAVLPLDSRETFGRYLSLVDGIDPPRHLMHVQRAGHGLAGLPTAHGLYMALLAQVSSSTVVPLPKLDDAGGVSDIDEAFEKLEKGFFDASTKGDVPDGHSYFVVPFYVATLPLFCVVLNFTDALPISTTDQEVYIAVLRNFARLVSREVQLAFERDLLRVFVDSALTNLEMKQKLTREAALAEIEGALKQTQQKPWKSWLLTIPSRSIAELSVVQQEAIMLAEMFGRARVDALADVIERIANWFHRYGFFAGEGTDLGPHEEPRPVHAMRLAQMLKWVKCNCVMALTESDEFGPHDEIATVLDWLAKHLERIRTGLLPGAEADVEAFRKVKSVFCRDSSNSAFRFSSDRLMSLCEIYIPGKVNLGFLREPNGVVISGDPIPRIIRVARELGLCFSDLINTVSLATTSSGRSPTEVTKEYTLSIKMHQTFAPTRAIGMDGRHLNEALGAATGNVIDRPFDAMELSFVIQANLQEKQDVNGHTKVEWVSAELKKCADGSLIKVVLT